MEYKEIVIHWSKLHKANNTEDVEKIEMNTADVLYQLYGDSHIYGRNVLLYIGKSIDAKKRLKQHLKGVFGHANNLQISIGTIEYNGKLEVPESILIANHKPSFNKEYIHDISEDAKDAGKIIIINNGNNHMLKTCCTNYWWVN